MHWNYISFISIQYISYTLKGNYTLYFVLYYFIRVDACNVSHQQIACFQLEWGRQEHRLSILVELTPLLWKKSITNHGDDYFLKVI